jgi:hypothetical protein
MISTYRSNLGKMFLIALPPSAFIGTASLVMFFSETELGWKYLYAVLAFLVILGLTLFYFLYTRITIQITEEEVRFIRCGRIYALAVLKDKVFEPHVTHLKVHIDRNLFLYVLTSTRYLRVKYPDGSKIDYPCFGFSQKNFERLIYEVQIAAEHARKKSAEMPPVAVEKGESIVDDPFLEDDLFNPPFT